MKKLNLKDGAKIPCLGQGTWYLGENKAKEESEIKTLQYGVENGMYLIDTAEMYGNGKSELLVGKAIKKYNRNDVFIVSKVYPWNAGKDNIFDACKDSLSRMNIEYLDMYLLHWRGNIPLKETVDCMEELVKQGKIRRWGVSNFDTSDMEELLSLKNGKNCCVNQVLYHLGSRGVEYNLLPYLEDNNIPLMAYCPMAQGGSLKRELVTNRNVLSIAEKYSISPYQVLLAFVIQKSNVFAIPRASKLEHVIENSKTADIMFSDEDLYFLNKAFPAPKHKTYLDIV